MLDVLSGDMGWTPRGLGASRRLPLGQEYMLCGGGGWAPRCAAVAEGERLPMGRGHVLWGGRG
jgi:hypothetical protein